MKVKDLIVRLNGLDPELIVFYEHDEAGTFEANDVELVTEYRLNDTDEYVDSWRVDYGHVARDLVTEVKGVTIIE